MGIQDPQLVSLSLPLNPVSGLYETPGAQDRPQLLVSEYFESGTIGKFEYPAGLVNVKAVTDNPYQGEYSLRGNLAVVFGGNDPITGLPREGSNTVNFRLTDYIPNNRTLPSVYVEYWMRWDDADNLNNGPNNDGIDIGPSSPKLAYFSDNSLAADTVSSLYPTVNIIKGIGALARNPGGIDPLPIVDSADPDYIGSASVFGECSGCGFNYDGVWAKAGVRFDYAASTIEMWINSVKYIDTAGFNGVIPISPDFRLDMIRFWHANSPGFTNSVNRTGEKGGWQIDSFEVWTDIPHRGV